MSRKQYNDSTIEDKWFRLGLSCLTPLSTIFQLYLVFSFIVGGIEVPEENHQPDASQ